MRKNLVYVFETYTFISCNNRFYYSLNLQKKHVNSERYECIRKRLSDVEEILGEIHFQQIECFFIVFCVTKL